MRYNPRKANLNRLRSLNAPNQARTRGESQAGAPVKSSGELPSKNTNHGTVPTWKHWTGVSAIALALVIGTNITTAIDVVHDLGWQGALVVLAWAFMLISIPQIRVRMAQHRRATSYLWLVPMTVLVVATIGTAKYFTNSNRASAAASPDTAADKANIDWHGRALHDRNFVKANLSFANMSGARLTRVNLSGSRLDGADMQRAVLTETEISGASLCGVDARGADFRRASGLDEASSFNYLLYDDTTQWPEGFNIEDVKGPVHTWSGSLVFSCKAGEFQTRTTK